MPKRNFLSLTDLTLVEARELLALSATLKAEPKGARLHALRGRSVAIVMEKASTRTRVSFEVGAASLGAHPVVLTAQGSQLARGEPIKDTARVLAGYTDLIVYRTYGSERLHEMASFARVPVINALSDDGHPVQVLADVFTIEEASGPIRGKRVAFVGDCSSNMACSWIEAARLFDFHLVLVGPEAYRAPREMIATAEGHVTETSDAIRGVFGADVINTDVWTSMGQESESASRLRVLSGFTVDDAMVASAKPTAIVLHCLPAHRGEEIAESVLEGAMSRVWDQAENRLHVQKALMLFLLGQS